MQDTGDGRGAPSHAGPTTPYHGGMIRCLVVDDHLSFAQAMEQFLNLEDDLECVGIATRVPEALELVLKHQPDVVLLDIDLPEIDGIKGTEQIKAAAPQTKVLIITGHASVELMSRAAAAGASGFIPKEAPISETVKTIRTLQDGGMMVDHAVLTAVLHRLQEGEATAKRRAAILGDLTDREMQVLVAMSRGLTPQSIAQEFGIRVSTVRGYQRSLFEKLCVHTQLEAVVVAIKQGLIVLASDS